MGHTEESGPGAECSLVSDGDCMGDWPGGVQQMATPERCADRSLILAGVLTDLLFWRGLSLSVPNLVEEGGSGRGEKTSAAGCQDC